MKLRITVLPGDGIGPEVTREALRVLRVIRNFTGYDFQFRECLMGGVAIREKGAPLPQETLDSCMESNAVLLGAVGGPEFDSLPSDKRPEAGLLQLRKALGGFANLRPAVALGPILDCSPLRPEVVQGADILIVRELLGGLYFGEPRGFRAGGGTALNTMQYSTTEIERVAKLAFEQARRRRKLVTSVDKANILETSRLWREVVIRVSREYPDVTLEHLYVDNCAMQLVLNPRRFDVILTENMFGDILSDEAAVLVGSLGMLASATIGGAVDLYEPVHGTAPDIAGTGRANPLGAIGSAAMLLRHTAKLETEAADVEKAIRLVLENGNRTADLLGGRKLPFVTTTEMGSLVEQALFDLVDQRHAYHAV